jgi:hypothetical protein
LKNNSYSREIKICNEKTFNKPKIAKDCRMYCDRDCQEEYIYSRIEVNLDSSKLNEFSIKVDNHPFYIYEAFPKYSLLI